MKTITDLQIKPDNIKAHADIGSEMERHKKSWYHFEIRISNGNIVDYVMREYIQYEKPKQK